ncbi:MAG: hypothetical protein GTO14_19220 [Anaerolineales bacterium]|nr:hypothetical protein [Anaerolineales bacterium]
MAERNHWGYIRQSGGPRAADLFRRLDLRFINFVEGLPDPLRTVARCESTFSGRRTGRDFPGLRSLNPALIGTPWLFWEAFTTLPDDQILDIAEAGMLYVLASVIMDHIIDRQVENPESAALLHQAFCEGGIAKYRRIFQTGSPFWDHFDRLTADQQEGLAIELDMQSNPRRMDITSFRGLTYGKVAPMVITVAALATAADRLELLPALEDALELISIASQLLDDVEDWRSDFDKGHMTYFLGQLMCHPLIENTGNRSVVELQSVLGRSWLDVDHLRQVLDWLDRSIEVVQDLQCRAWVDYVDGYKRLADKYLTLATADHLLGLLEPLVSPIED